MLRCVPMYTHIFLKEYNNNLYFVCTHWPWNTTNMMPCRLHNVQYLLSRSVAASDQPCISCEETLQASDAQSPMQSGRNIHAHVWVVQMLSEIMYGLAKKQNWEMMCICKIPLPYLKLCSRMERGKCTCHALCWTQWLSCYCCNVKEVHIYYTHQCMCSYRLYLPNGIMPERSMQHITPAAHTSSLVP